MTHRVHDEHGGVVGAACVWLGPEPAYGEPQLYEHDAYCCPEGWTVGGIDVPPGSTQFGAAAVICLE